MVARLRRLRQGGGEQGLTLVELLVASAMSVVLMMAIGSMVVSATRTQPNVSERAQNISSARWLLERMTREIRNGVRVDQATASKVSFLTYVRRSSCGGSGVPASTTAAIKCEVTYQCTATACSRIEAASGVYTGTARTMFAGLGSANVFCFVPSVQPDPLTCGSPQSAAQTTYIGVKLQLPNPSGGDALIVSDGASLRNATLLR